MDDTGSNSAGRLVMVDLPGHELTPEQAGYLRTRDIGGVCLFGKNVRDRHQVRELVGQLREAIGPHALIAIDQEGGGVLRTTDLPNPPSAMSLGASNDPDLARQVGALTGRGLRSMGVNWDFAPVLDVNSNPDNPVISDRSFGQDPAAVAQLALAWAEGLQAEGVASCGKHFPGHGDTSLDSHLDLPTVRRDQARLDALDLLPFRAAVQAGLPALMTAHIVYPAIDPDLPATLSPRVLTGLLRERWGFDGVICTDSMGMKAIDDNWGRGEAGVMALAAGADMVMALGSLDEQTRTLDAIERAAHDGTLDAGRLARSRERLEDLARRFPAEPRDYAPELEATDRALARAAWARGLTLVGGPRLPAPGSQVVLVAPEGVPGENVNEGGWTGAELAAALEGALEVQRVFYPLEDPAAALPALRAAPEGAYRIVATTGRYRPRDAARALMREARPNLHLALWNPYSAADVDAPAVLTYGFRHEALAALASLLRGETQATGTLPVSLP